MKTDTAHRHWNNEWSDIDPDSRWLKPEEDVIAWAGALEAGCKILDLGAGVGRHALWLAQNGFDVVAFDAAPAGLASIDKAGLGVKTVLGMMTELPFSDNEFDHVLSWNVIYHGDEAILSQSISEIARVLKPHGTYMGTMLSKRRLEVERARSEGTEVSPNTWVFGEEGDKAHPHYYCNALELVALFDGFETMWLEDNEHDKPGAWHWHVIMENMK